MRRIKRQGDRDRNAYKREFLAELRREWEGYYGEYLRSGQRTSRLDYVLEYLEVNESIGVRETGNHIEWLWAWQQETTEAHKRELLAELISEREGYYGIFLRSGKRRPRLDYALKTLGIKKSLGVRET